MNDQRVLGMGLMGAIGVMALLQVLTVWEVIPPITPNTPIKAITIERLKATQTNGGADESGLGRKDP